MKVIIASGDVKRELRGGFSICGSQQDLRWIAEQILGQTGDDFSYGWIAIPEIPHRHGLVNTAPWSWENNLPAPKE